MTLKRYRRTWKGPYPKETILTWKGAKQLGPGPQICIFQDYLDMRYQDGNVWINHQDTSTLSLHTNITDLLTALTVFRQLVKVLPKPYPRVGHNCQVDCLITEYLKRHGYFSYGWRE